MGKYVILLPLLLPLLGGACLPLLHLEERKPRQIYVAAVVLVNTLLTFWILFHNPGETVTLFAFNSKMDISFRLDGLGSVFAGLVAALWPLATIYSFEYMKHEGKEIKFFAFYTMTYGVTLGIAFSASVMTLYLFYELLTFITLPLVMHAMDKRAVAAGKKYLIYSISGASAAFIGIMILSAYSTGLTFRYGGVLEGAGAPDPSGILLAGYLLTFLGFGVKAAVFPFHGWLPSAGVAPTPVTALLHAVAVVKAGVFAIMRMTYYGYGAETLRGSWVQNVVMAMAVITIVFGSAMAWKDQHIKRRLAYSTISNLSYILLGVTMMTPAGLAGGLTHMLFHGVIKICLFFCAGAFIYKTQREYVPEYTGFGKGMPKTMAAFTIGSLALTGTPLLAGFISKYSLASAAVESGNPLAFAGIGALLLSAVLTAGYLYTIVVPAYFPGREFQPARLKGVEDPNGYMTVPLLFLCVAMVLFGTCSSGLVSLLQSVGAGLL